MIKGTTYIYGKLVCVLIDPGATFSFISSAFVMHNKLKLSSRDEPVIVSMPMGLSVIYETVVKDLLVRIGENNMKWDLYPCPLVNLMSY